MRTYSIYLPNQEEPEAEIIVKDDEMIVYDVCKIKDYEGGDYVPRKAREMDHVVLPIGECHADH
tara:strand:+ start:33644 stop:33835 length:192 start_codon:yes stop_codon:yes gene_type:complete